MLKGSHNVYEGIPEDLSEEWLERLVESDRVRIERIVSKGQRSPVSGWYDQAQNEWVLVLKGEAVLVFEGHAPCSLRAGDYLDIPAHVRHRVEWTHPEVETIWLAIHY